MEADLIILNETMLPLIPGLKRCLRFVLQRAKALLVITPLIKVDGKTFFTYVYLGHVDDTTRLALEITIKSVNYFLGR